jgi:class 3 adenylate cyclase
VPLNLDMAMYCPAGRMQYSGVGLEMARAVQGAACGGQVLISESTCKLVGTTSRKRSIIGSVPLKLLCMWHQVPLRRAGLHVDKHLI